MAYAITNDHAAGNWVAKRINGVYHTETSRSIGLARGGVLVAGVIYENWNHRSIVCHIAAEGRMTPAYIAAIFDYPFNVCQVDKIIVPVVSENSESIRLVEHMGFEEEGRIKDGHPEGDIVLYTLARDACRFLSQKFQQRIHHGQIQSITAACS